METNELVDELESRGVSINKCQMRSAAISAKCGKPATRYVNMAYRCEECHVGIVRSELRAKYLAGSFEIGSYRARYELIDAVHKATMDGRAPEVIARWVAIKTGLSWEELREVEDEVFTSRKMKLWIVGGKGKFGTRDDTKLVLARSDLEARKVWREELYKRRSNEIPDRDKIVVTEVTGVKEPQVISDYVEFHLEYVLGIHGEVT